MSPETDAPTKVFEQRVVYRLLVADEDTPTGLPKRRQVVCTYHNGVRIFGKEHGDHPPVLISAKDQDEIVWAGAVPFKVGLKRAANQLGPAKPFYRDQDLWIATKGNDNIYRMATGPVNPEGLSGSAEYKFTVTRLLPDGTPDPESEPLDPHIVVEP